MTSEEFFIKWHGKYCDFGPQCVDLIKQYFVDVLGIQLFHGNAIDYWNKGVPGFTKVPYSLGAIPQLRSLVVWAYSMPFGHIGICNWTTQTMFNCFEQNNPPGAPCNFVTHFDYNSVLGWLNPLSMDILPHNPLKVIRVGLNLPSVNDFIIQVATYSSNKIVCTVQDAVASINIGTGMFTQQMAYDLMEKLGIREKFVFIFYPPNNTSSFYASYYYPKRDCMITTCPGTDARILSFEFSHQLQMYFNVHHGMNPPVQVVDSNFPTDDLIKSKYDSISKYYL